MNLINRLIGRTTPPSSQGAADMNLDEFDNQWRLQGVVSKLQPTKKGCRFTLVQMKQIKSGAIKPIFHKVEVPYILAAEVEEWLANNMIVNVEGELFHAEEPYCLAHKLDMI